MNVIANSKLEKEPGLRPRPSHLISIQEETSTFLKEHIQKQKFRSTTRKYISLYVFILARVVVITTLRNIITKCIFV